MKNLKITILFALLFAISGCRPGTTLPARSSPEYNELVRTFYVGLAALEVGHDVQAEAKLSQFTQLAASEPAGWANWGLLALRQRNYDTAAERLHRARDLAPDNSNIHYLIGLLESSRGNTPQAITELRKAVELDQTNLIATYKLAEEVEREGGDKSAEEFQNLIQKILTAQPDNLAALVELARAAAKRGDAETLKSAVEKINARSSAWPDEVREQVTALDAAVKSGDMRAAATRTGFLRNVLVRVPEYRRNLSAIKPPPGEEAIPLSQFVKLEAPVFTTAASDTAITFKPEQISQTGPGTRWDWIGAISLSGDGPPVIATATGREVWLPSGAVLRFPGGEATPPDTNGILPVDFNYDFKTDLVLTGWGGVRFFRQDNPSAFTDVTNRTKLSSAILNKTTDGAWAADIEADGDLDIVLAAYNTVPTVLRNNGDETFTEIQPFSKVEGLRDFTWADLDADGDPDAAIVDSSFKLHVFSNERQGQFTERLIPADTGSVNVINVMDVDSDGVLDLLLVKGTTITRLSDKDHGTDWVKTEIATFPQLTNGLNFATTDLQVADVDNNGGLDLVVLSSYPFKIPVKCAPPGCTRGALVWLNDGSGKFIPKNDAAWTDSVFAVADVNNDGRLDLLGLSENQYPQQAINNGTKNYHWQIVRPRAAQATGDQRINSFGVGGEIEVRSGLVVQKQPITGPLVHFGLGEQTSTDVIRIVWPNGSVRADFEIKADQEVQAEQRLKGSCPFLFAYNGKQMEFVKDAVPWSSAIGLRINTLGTARVEATEEWYKIGRDQLVPRDGYYDLRITAELWETYYYDHLSLMVVDHPEGTEIFVDERFVIPPAKLAVTTVSTPRKIAKAIDDNGQDVTNTVNALDGNHLDTFGRGRYQGVTRDHYVEVDLGDDAPTSGPLWLIAHGWMHPTDSSINVAISQGQQEKAKPLSLEVPDGRGGWEVVRPNLGFPAGRKKICLFDLTNVFRSGTPRRLRLRTNLEVYWDSLEWAVGLPDAEPSITRLNPDAADLHHRGYSVINQANDSSPQIPDYNRLAGSKQIWRDLIGYYTRFGDVRELLMRADDRYVIMNAGDEMTFRFAAPSSPPSGWVRDYVIVGDGWIKDGDYNSTFSKTVLPLPYHAENEYITPPGRLEDEWVYRQFPEDWQNYHTRYVTADVFQNALRSKQKK
ncbi:MAG TPA: FG-GAP-like repeat-containing protein [Pyrinomonadaceae bacterium]|nr:FG-GAP-like repeat-containing protein [Pyrinomonadaceae bacterium]